MQTDFVMPSDGEPCDGVKRLWRNMSTNEDGEVSYHCRAGTMHGLLDAACSEECDVPDHGLPRTLRGHVCIRNYDLPRVSPYLKGRNASKGKSEGDSKGKSKGDDKGKGGKKGSPTSKGKGPNQDGGKGSPYDSTDPKGYKNTKAAPGGKGKASSPDCDKGKGKSKPAKQRPPVTEGEGSFSNLS